MIHTHGIRRLAQHWRLETLTDVKVLNMSGRCHTQIIAGLSDVLFSSKPAVWTFSFFLKICFEFANDLNGPLLLFLAPCCMYERKQMSIIQPPAQSLKATELLLVNAFRFLEFPLLWPQSVIFQVFFYYYMQAFCIFVLFGFFPGESTLAFSISVTWRSISCTSSASPCLSSVLPSMRSLSSCPALGEIHLHSPQTTHVLFRAACL